MIRPMYRGGPPKPTGVFDPWTEFPPTKLSFMYDNGELPCKIDMVGGENAKLKQGRAIKWVTPIKELDLEKILPVFVEGLREKHEPQIYIAEMGLEELIAKSSVKRLLKAIRSIVYPLKDNLRTLDDDICVKTFKCCQQIVRKSDKLAEALVPHFHIILPMFEIVLNRHREIRINPAMRRRY